MNKSRPACDRIGWGVVECFAFYDWEIKMEEQEKKTSAGQIVSLSIMVAIYVMSLFYFYISYHDISVYHEQPFVFNNQIHYASEPVSRSTTVQPLKRFSLSFVSLPRNMSFPPLAPL